MFKKFMEFIEKHPYATVGLTVVTLGTFLLGLLGYSIFKSCTGRDDKKDKDDKESPLNSRDDHEDYGSIDNQQVYQRKGSSQNKIDLYNQQQLEKFEKRDIQTFGNATNNIVSVGINALNICERMAQTNYDLLATNQQLANTADKALFALEQANENQKQMVEDMKDMKDVLKQSVEGAQKLREEREARLKENKSKSYVAYTEKKEESKSRDNSLDPLNRG